MSLCLWSYRVLISSHLTLFLFSRCFRVWSGYLNRTFKFGLHSKRSIRKSWLFIRWLHPFDFDKIKTKASWLWPISSASPEDLFLVFLAGIIDALALVKVSFLKFQIGLHSRFKGLLPIFSFANILSCSYPRTTSQKIIIPNFLLQSENTNSH